LGVEPGTIVYEPGGCEACGNSGFKGRIGVFEAIRIDDTIRRLINDGGDEVAIARHAYANEPNLSAAARQLVCEGLTTPEEAVRISRRGSDDG
jgi:general secretion pathway protein E